MHSRLQESCEQAQLKQCKPCLLSMKKGPEGPFLFDVIYYSTLAQD
ncbi:hypothetical protein GSG51_11375 [Vibrio cholerae]|nr:hypothetical protein [Vibrio paracholerae]MEB5519953.1 hypothetical protein [Vibrio cholerae]NOE08556.1 hypothetical protein [Vibrio cholerae]